MHEITDENSVLNLCSPCCDKLGEVFRNTRSRMFKIGKCLDCSETGIINLMTPSGKDAVILNDDGTPMETYVEREGV